jgi:hypothetical protein
MNDESRIRGAGGTPGGIGEFFLGLVMVVIGGYLITNRIVVVSNYWSWGGYSMFGLSLLPLIIGIGILFFNGKSIVGWILLFLGVVIIFAGVLMNLQIYFQATSLFATIAMLVLLAGGIGLIFRALAPHAQSNNHSD